MEYIQDGRSDKFLLGDILKEPDHDLIQRPIWVMKEPEGCGFESCQNQIVPEQDALLLSILACVPV
jgi:hypothetical protein